MDITVLGTGGVGRSVAGRLDDLGHHVTMATREPSVTAGRDEHAAWAAAHAGVALAPFAGSVTGADLVVNALGGDIALGVLAEVGPELVGRVLLDLSNPLDHSQGFPPRLFVKDDDSLAEQLQRAHPEALVVKTLNTMNNAVMVDPARLPEGTTVFVSGDDPGAKAAVVALLRELGHSDVIDLGGLETARGPEMFLALWIRTAVALGGSDFNIKVVRGPSLPS
ncbi:NADPH-dependent F420 reductase [Nocardioides sp. URHA0020]|uniref:NADPH-dependent F420 reductase n=1 Tax=Nocardioides sp. URHA0020 TaxID=1380392 RepID=UPI00048F345F|nr:NAD(P)-binding domain-containing protein [Nocardioides sp. URHA0020]